MSSADATVANPEERDPFEAFNEAMGAGFVTDPYPELAELRKQGGLVPMDLGMLTGEEAGEGEEPQEVEAIVGIEDMPAVFIAASYEAVHQVLRDGDTFSSKGYEEVMGAVFGHSILEMDEPEHRTYRGLIQQAFTRKAMEWWEAELVQPIVDRLIDEFVAEGQVDLVRALTFPFPMYTIAGMLGLPDDDLDRFHRLAVEMISVSFDMDLALRSSAELGTWFDGLAAERRGGDGRDLISVLGRAELDGQHLTDQEITAFCRLLLTAGAETTYRSSSNLLFGLLSHTDQLDAVRDDRSLLPQAIEEALRWEPPLLIILRTATRDVEVAGVTVPEDGVVVTNLGSANHDDARWDEPERFDIFREQQPHIAFATGPHMCLGMHLARMETTVVVNAVLDRLADVRIDPDAAAPFITGQTFRAPSALPVVFTPPS
jgi:cytochrome P450